MQISWWTLAIQGLNFLVLVWLLRRFLYRPVQEVVEKRRRLELQATQAAEAAKAEAEAVRSRYEQALAGIDNERKQALEGVRGEIEAERKKIIEDAGRTAADSVARARKEIERDKVSALESLRKDVVDLAMRVSGKLLADIAPSVPSEAHLARLEAGIEGMDAEERRRLEAEIETNGAEVTVVTSRALDAEERVVWKTRIERMLDHPLEVAFTEEAELISGAELRLPHTVLRASWSDQLKRASEALRRGGHAGLS